MDKYLDVSPDLTGKANHMFTLSSTYCNISHKRHNDQETHFG